MAWGVGWVVVGGWRVVGFGWFGLDTITVGWMDEYLLAQAGVFFVIWKGVRALARLFSGPIGMFGASSVFVLLRLLTVLQTKII